MYYLIATLILSPFLLIALTFILERKVTVRSALRTLLLFPIAIGEVLRFLKFFLLTLSNNLADFTSGWVQPFGGIDVLNGVDEIIVNTSFDILKFVVFVLGILGRGLVYLIVSILLVGVLIIVIVELVVNLKILRRWRKKLGSESGGNSLSSPSTFLLTFTIILIPISSSFLNLN